MPRRNVAEPGPAYGLPGGSGEESISMDLSLPLKSVKTLWG